MPAPKYKSGSAKKVYKRAPGNRRVLHIRRKKQSLARCSTCGALLGGVPSGRIVQVSKMAKTQKRPERAFGGVLCPKCVKKLMIIKARNF